MSTCSVRGWRSTGSFTSLVRPRPATRQTLAISAVTSFVRHKVVVATRNDDGKRGNVASREGVETQEEDVDARQFRIEQSRRPAQRTPPTPDQQDEDAPRDIIRKQTISFAPNQKYPATTHEVSEPRIGRRPDTTMTDRELEVFQRLFKSIQGGRRLQVGSSHGYDEEKAAEDLEELDLDDEFKADPILSEDPGVDPKEVEIYPEVLQDLARETSAKSKKDKAAAKRSGDPVLRKVEELTMPIMRQLWKAESDAAVWEIIDKEVFDTVRKLKLDEPEAAPVKPKRSRKPLKSSATETTKEAPSFDVQGKKESRSELHLFSLVYQRVLLLASKVLCRRTSYTPLAIALLPAIKALGPSSYAMGVTTGLFNELIQYHWRVYSSMTPVLSMLSEMDRMTCPMNARTLEVLDEITSFRAKAEAARFGEAGRQLELQPERRREGQEIWRWKKQIQARLEDAEMEKLRRQERERQLRLEGALGEDEVLAEEDDDEAVDDDESVDDLRAIGL